MRYDNNNKRIHWLTICLNAIPDILIALIITVIMKGAWANFLIAFFALQLIYPLLWIKNALVKWLLATFGRASSDAAKWAYLRDNGYPQPDSREYSAEYYLSSVIENASLPDEMRLKAAFDLSAINVIGKGNHLLKPIRYEEALARYKADRSKDMI